MIERLRFAAVLGIVAAMPVLQAAAEGGPFAFRAPPPGTVLVYSDGFEVAFGRTEGRVTTALAGPKSAPRSAKIEIEDSFTIRRIQRGTRLVTIKNTVEAPGFWPLVPGATRRYRMEVALDGKPRQTQNAVARFAKTTTALDLAGKARRVIRVDIDIRWSSADSRRGRVAIVYWYDLDLGYYVKRSYVRYAPEGRPGTPRMRELVRVDRVAKTPKP